jgi:hypothetical protein
MAGTIPKQAGLQLPLEFPSPRDGKNDFKASLYCSFLKTLNSTDVERAITKQPLVAASNIVQKLEAISK